ncbi:MAG: amino acid ABC transporter permease [Immundisolibacterales bacterium]|nr:amino acid ABC transporter permease [Immundisolibacterales bacterium]
MSWSWDTFLAYIADPLFVRAAAVTVWVAVASQVIGVVVGLGVALMQLAQNPVVRFVANAYVWFWRGSPLLVQLFLLYFGLPQLGIRLNVIEAGLIGLGLNASGFMAEIIRGTILSVDRGELEAARSLGMSRGQTMRRIILPQAARLIVPPLGNEFLSNLRTTSLLSVISFEELLRVTTLAINETFRATELYAVAAVYYLAMTTVWTLIQAGIERRLGVSAGRDRAPGRRFRFAFKI